MNSKKRILCPTVILTFACVVILHWAASPATAQNCGDFLSQWSDSWSPGNNFLRGLDVDSYGNVYTIEMFFPTMVKKFNSNGGLLFSFGSEGHAAGQLVAPSDIAVDGAGNSYITSQSASQPSLKKFDANGMELWRTPAMGTGPGDADGQFRDPIGVAVNAAGTEVYVADSTNGRVQVFDSGSGAFLRKWGSLGMGDGQFGFPTGIDLDSFDNVYVVDSVQNRVQVFESDGTFLRKWGAAGSSDGQFNVSWHIYVDDSNRVYVTDTFNFRVQVFGASGNFLGKFGSQGTGPGQFEFAFGIAVNSSGDIFVSEGGGTVQPRVQKFAGCASPSTLVSLAPARLWVGLKNSDDQGTRFDLRAELYVNDTLVAEGTTRCVEGVTRNPAKAKEVAVEFGDVSQDLAMGDVLSLKVSTRIGTNEDGTKCAGHNNAVALRLYYDGSSRPSRFGAVITPDPLDFYLHSIGSTFFFDALFPAATQPKQVDSGPVNFAGGNPWVQIGTWSYEIP